MRRPLPVPRRGWKSFYRMSSCWTPWFLSLVGLWWGGSQWKQPPPFANNDNSPRESDKTQWDDFSLEPPAACREFLFPLNSSMPLTQIAAVFVRDYKERSKQKGLQNLTTHKRSIEWAEGEWERAMEACHGPLQDFDKTYSLRNEGDESVSVMTGRMWMNRLHDCALQHQRRQGGAPFCQGRWATIASAAFVQQGLLLPQDSSLLPNRRSIEPSLVYLFTETARCALRFPFSLVASGQRVILPQEARNHRSRPQRAHLVTLAMGDDDEQETALSKTCRLMETAMERKWNVVAVTGPWKGMQSKYSSTLQALQTAFENDDDDDDVLVVFVDGHDVLVQQTPDYVLNEFAKQPHDFVWSSEDNCYPNRDWPYSLGLSEIVCDALFPVRTFGNGRAFVNSGGWMATLGAAKRVMEEFHRILFHPDNNEEPRGHAGRCISLGTDQFVGNVAYLRHGESYMGLDVNQTLFLSDMRDHLQQENVSLSLQQIPMAAAANKEVPNNELSAFPAWCHVRPRPDGRQEQQDDGGLPPPSSPLVCPAFLHFNGEREGDNAHKAAWRALQLTSSGDDKNRCASPASLTLIDLSESGTPRKTEYDPSLLIRHCPHWKPQVCKSEYGKPPYTEGQN